MYVFAVQSPKPSRKTVRHTPRPTATQWRSNSLSLKLADDANPSRSEPSKLQPSWTPLHSIRCTSSVATMYIRRYVHMFVILVICVYPSTRTWLGKTENSASRTTNSQLLGSVRSNQTVLCMYLQLASRGTRLVFMWRLILASCISAVFNACFRPSV